MMGLGCDKDEAAAADVYTSLSLKGHSQATYNLASMYAEGRGRVPTCCRKRTLIIARVPLLRGKSFVLSHAVCLAAKYRSPCFQQIDQA